MNAYPAMEDFLKDQCGHASNARLAIRKDFACLLMTKKKEIWLRQFLKARMMQNMRDLELSNVLINWTLERPDDAGSFVSKV